MERSDFTYWGGLSLFGSRRNSPRAPCPRRTCHLQVADQGQLWDFVRASEPGVPEAASLEQRRKLSPSLSNFERVSWEEERARVSQGRTRGDRAAQPGSRGRGDPVPRLRRACKQHLNGAAQPSAGAGPHPSDHGPGGRPRSRRGFLAATAAWGSRRPFSFIPHPASSCLYRFPPSLPSPSPPIRFIKSPFVSLEAREREGERDAEARGGGGCLPVASSCLGQEGKCRRWGRALGLKATRQESRKVWGAPGSWRRQCAGQSGRGHPWPPARTAGRAARLAGWRGGQRRRTLRGMGGRRSPLAAALIGPGHRGRPCLGFALPPAPLAVRTQGVYRTC